LLIPDVLSLPAATPESDEEKALIQFVRSRLISHEELAQRIRELNPELADFLDILDRNEVLSLRLNPVGMMLAAQEEMHRKPGEVSSLLQFFEPSGTPKLAAE
jgi:hypothetical protein